MTLLASLFLARKVYSKPIPIMQPRSFEEFLRLIRDSENKDG